MKNEILTKFANQDIRLARREGSITITQTKKGNVTLSRQENGNLEVSGADVNWSTGEIKNWSIVGPVGMIRETLCNLYQVVMA